MKATPAINRTLGRRVKFILARYRAAAVQSFVAGKPIEYPFSFAVKVPHDSGVLRFVQ